MRRFVSLARETHRRLRGLMNQLLRFRRHETMILLLAHHLHATRPAMQRRVSFTPNLPAHQARQQQVARGAEFLVLKMKDSQLLVYRS